MNKEKEEKPEITDEELSELLRKKFEDEDDDDKVAEKGYD